MDQVTESSVAFNLAEIMRLEAERVAAEQAALAEAAARAAREREQRLALAREEAARMHAQAIERELVEREQSERRAREHQEALLRIRLEAEAGERLERDRLAFEHMRACELIARQARSRRLVRAMWLLAPALAIAVAAAGYAGFHAADPQRVMVPVAAPRGDSVEPSVAAAGAPTLPVAAGWTGPAAEVSSTAAAPRAARAKARAPREQRSTPAATGPAQIGEVETDDDDPLIGILDEPPAPRSTSRRRSR